MYKARDTRLDRIVALKISKTAFDPRFDREARAIASLNHAHICTLYDVGPDYLVMEYIEGAPLQGPLPFEDALRIGIQIAGALQAAHARGILHRDLKPANILLTASGAKLLDFGLAKFNHGGQRRRDRTDHGRHGGRHRGVHVSRAGRRGSRWTNALGYLQLRRRAVRDAFGHAARSTAGPCRASD